MGGEVWARDTGGLGRTQAYGEAEKRGSREARKQRSREARKRSKEVKKQI
jgi:hypothetical protein